MEKYKKGDIVKGTITGIEKYGAFIKIDEGYDVVFAKYNKVQQNFFRNFTSRINAWMARVLTEKPRGVETASFFCMRRYVADNMIKYDRPYPYISGLQKKQIRARFRVKPARICFIFHWEGRFRGSHQSFRPAIRYASFLSAR